MTRVTLLRGDGIGPEIMDASLRMVEATGVSIEWEEKAAGTNAVAEHGSPLPEDTLQSIRDNRVAFKAPLMTPIGGGFKSVNVHARQALDLFANVRPVQTLEGVDTRYKDVELVVVRENTQGLYAGLEHYLDNTKKKKVTLVHKANILKLTTGLFLRVGQEIAAEYPDVEFEDRIIDAMAMQLVLHPERFGVIVTTNLFGDILSDLTAGLIGGLGLAPSGNYGNSAAIFEAIHGTAPDIAGQGIANPPALALSGAMMLRHLGHKDKGDRLEKAIRDTLIDGKVMTPDLGGSASTGQFADAVIAKLS